MCFSRMVMLTYASILIRGLFCDCQAEVLYQKVEEQCALKGDGSEVLLDLFCGTGTIGLSMAKR